MIVSAVIRSVRRIVWQYQSFRNMSGAKMSTSEKVAAMTPNELVKNMVGVSDWNKRLLVFAGRFKTMEEVPDILPFSTVDKARNQVRIKVANVMILLTIIACVGMVVSGKQAAEAGQSVTQQNLDWHKEYNENNRKGAEQAKK